MSLRTMDFFGLSVTYRVEARKAGPTIFLSLRSSDGVHINGVGRIYYEHKGRISRAPEATGMEEYVRTLVPECLQQAFDPTTKEGRALREKFAKDLPLAALTVADFNRVAQSMKWANPTKKEHKKWLDLLVSKFGRIPFCEITQEKFALHLREGGFSGYQINGQICAMRALVAYEEAQYLVSEHFVDTFIMDNRRVVVGPRDASRHFEKNILTHAQVREIAASCAENLESGRGYLYLGAMLLVTTGITISELCALTWGSFSSSNTYTGVTVIEIEAEAKRVGEVYRTEELNGPRRRTIPLSPTMAKLYNTLIDSAISWIEPTDEAKWNAIDALEDAGIDASEEEFMELFNAWILSTCDNAVILGHTIKDTTREKVRPNYVGYGVTKDSKFSTSIRKIMGWSDNDPISAKWNRILRETFMDEGSESNGKYYIDLSRVKPRFDLSHTWFRCEHCSELTPYMLKGKCPNCQHESIHPMTDAEISALDFWRKPINDALQGEPIRAIDTEEHTAQLSHKDQRDELWSKTEQYELRFQDFLQNGEAPVDILSSTTTMEVGIDIGSLVAVGLRNIPPMRENYQQRAGRAGRRGSSLSTIVTFCEDGPHDSLYFSNPVPMFRGDPRKPWIDVGSEKIVQRHLGMVALQAYLRLKGNSLDVIPAIDFLDENLQDFYRFLDTFAIDYMSILVPTNSQKVLRSYKSSLKDSLSVLKLKRDAHPELFESDGSSDSSKKTFLDALYEEGIIPTYSFPKNVVSTYISDINGKVKYQVERGLDVAIGEYAPGRAIVVDKTTYQIGGLYYPGGGRTEQAAYSPARAFIQDASYCKNISTCTECGWFGLDEDHPHKCPFCGNDKLTHMLPMLRPWGFAPRDAKAIEQAQLSEEYTATQQPLYSTLPDADDVVAIKGYSNTKMAVRPNQRIIMLNKGIGDKGFTICCDCGAAMPGDDPSVLKDIMRPYRSKFLRTRCKHNETKNVNLGYDFITDMLVLEIALDRQQVSMDLAKNSWLNRAGQSLAEALRLSACQELDIEFTELVTGFRVRQNQKGDFIDIYLYDSLSSGAGYAVSIEASIQQLLIKTRELLSSCTCDSACHKCLKHYRNQYVHGLLDRSAALDLLTWAEKGVRSPMLPVYEQRNLLQSVEQILQFSGVHIDFNHEPIEAKSFHGKKRIVVYPAMWARPAEKNTVFVSDSYLKYAKPYALKTIVDGL